MKTLGLTFLLAAAAFNSPAQQWEIGGLGGGSFLNTAGVSSPFGSATAGFQTGFVGGGYFGQNLYPHLTGEVRYEFFESNLKIAAGNASGTFAGMAHAVHYDLILHTQRAHSPVQYFAAFGGGMKIFEGTGAETPFQATMQYGYMTRTHQVKPMISVGGGFTYRLSPHLYLRTEIRDFITPFPASVIAPPNSSVKYGSLLNDLVPMVGLDYSFGRMSDEH
jgi:hypothetical protein